eukprot:8162612-Alexandrium_andersonii.AAC.1
MSEVWTCLPVRSSLATYCRRFAITEEDAYDGNEGSGNMRMSFCQCEMCGVDEAAKCPSDPSGRSLVAWGTEAEAEGQRKVKGPRNLFCKTVWYMRFLDLGWKDSAPA